MNPSFSTPATCGSTKIGLELIEAKDIPAEPTSSMKECLVQPSMSATKDRFFSLARGQKEFSHADLATLDETRTHYHEGTLHGQEKRVLFGCLEPRDKCSYDRAARNLQRPLTREETLIDCRPHRKNEAKYALFHGVVFNPEGIDDVWTSLKDIAFYAGAISQGRTFCLVTPLRYYIDGGRSGTVNEILLILDHGYEAIPNPDRPEQTLFYLKDPSPKEASFTNYWVTRLTMGAREKANLVMRFQKFIHEVDKLRAPLIEKSEERRSQHTNGRGLTCTRRV